MKKDGGGNSGIKKNGKTAHPSLGPVNNLEAFLQPDWWKRIFNSMYLKTDADVVEDRSITTFELDLLSNILKLTTEDVILDLACGQGRHSLELGRRGFKSVYGLDRSHFLINKARQGKLITRRDWVSILRREMPGNCPTMTIPSM
ncbi:MAG: class I SAM-dependent methyltransferase [Bacteroidales bacterium]